MDENPRSIADLKPDPKNARRHTPRNVGMIVDALHEVGAARSIVVDEDGTILAGNATIEAAAEAGIERVQIVDTDGSTIVAVRRSGLTDEQKRKLAYYDNRTAELADWDASQIVEDIDAGLDLDGLWTGKELENLLVGEIEAQEVEEESLLERSDVPDAIWPTDNDWGVPLLDIEMQATALDLPMTKWGTVKRTAKMRGTWHFYTEDYKFQALWDDPSNVANSRCVNVIEPNFSSNLQMPRAAVLWGVYRKRWLARYWQSLGIKVFVDLEITPRCYDLALLGVPKGWNAYATRWYDKKGVDMVLEQVEMAREHARRRNILFVVVGGRQKAEEFCQEQGLLWVMEHAGYVNDGRE